MLPEPTSELRIFYNKNPLTPNNKIDMVPQMMSKNITSLHSQAFKGDGI
jgi:hypothetical protein